MLDLSCLPFSLSWKPLSSSFMRLCLGCGLSTPRYNLLQPCTGTMFNDLCTLCFPLHVFVICRHIHICTWIEYKSQQHSSIQFTLTYICNSWHPVNLCMDMVMDYSQSGECSKPCTNQWKHMNAHPSDVVHFLFSWMYFSVLNPGRFIYTRRSLNVLGVYE